MTTFCHVGKTFTTNHRNRFHWIGRNYFSLSYPPHKPNKNSTPHRRTRRKTTQYFQL